MKSKVSMMPKGLLDTFKEDEILDLVAYLMSRGDRNQQDVSVAWVAGSATCTLDCGGLRCEDGGI